MNWFFTWYYWPVWHVRKQVCFSLQVDCHIICPRSSRGLPATILCCLIYHIGVPIDRVVLGRRICCKLVNKYHLGSSLIFVEPLYRHLLLNSNDNQHCAIYIISFFLYSNLQYRNDGIIFKYYFNFYAIIFEL